MSDLSVTAAETIQYDECALVIPQGTSYSGYLTIKDKDTGQDLILMSTETITIKVTDKNDNDIITKSLSSSNYVAVHNGYYLLLSATVTNVAKGRHKLKVTYTDINSIVYPVNVAKYCLIV